MAGCKILSYDFLPLTIFVLFVRENTLDGNAYSPLVESNPVATNLIMDGRKFLSSTTIKFVDRDYF